MQSNNIMYFPWNRHCEALRSNLTNSDTYYWGKIASQSLAMGTLRFKAPLGGFLGCIFRNRVNLKLLIINILFAKRDL